MRGGGRRDGSARDLLLVLLLERRRESGAMASRSARVVEQLPSACSTTVRIHGCDSAMRMQVMEPPPQRQRDAAREAAQSAPTKANARREVLEKGTNEMQGRSNDLEQWRARRQRWQRRSEGESVHSCDVCYMKSSSALDADAASSALDTMFSALNRES
jgi:hypothetical protein